jgi:hypothetical protein
LLVAGLNEPESVSYPETFDGIERFDEFLDLLARDFGLPACFSVRLRESLGSFAIARISLLVGKLLRVDRKRISIIADFVGCHVIKVWVGPRIAGAK